MNNQGQIVNQAPNRMVSWLVCQVVNQPTNVQPTGVPRTLNELQSSTSKPRTQPFGQLTSVPSSNPTNQLMG